MIPARKRVFTKLFIPTEVGPVSNSDLQDLLDQLHKVPVCCTFRHVSQALPCRGSYQT